MKKFLIVSVSVISVLIVIVFLFSNKEKKIVTDIKALETKNIVQNNEINSKDIDAINVCLGYAEMYCTNNVPNDSKVLKQIVADIDSVLGNNIFYRGFRNSKYQNRLNLDESFCENGGMYGENFLITCYYKELVILKLKALLLLGDFDEFHSFFIENYNIIYIAKDNFATMISMDDNIYQNDELLKVILNSYDKILSLNLSEHDAFYIATDAMFMCINNEEAMKKYNSIREKNSDGEATVFFGIESKLLNQNQIYLYSYEC